MIIKGCSKAQSLFFIIIISYSLYHGTVYTPIETTFSNKEAPFVTELLHEQKTYFIQCIIFSCDNMFHEDKSKISEKTLNLKRAIDSLKEELEAVDWYNQRADACTDENLKKILIHNANEEKEHAAMILEWIRQNDEAFAKELKEYLFSGQKDIAGLEEESTTH